MPTPDIRVKAASRPSNRPAGDSSKSPLDDLYARPGFLLRRAHQIAVGIFVHECASFGLTPPQHSVLTAIARCPQLDQTTLAQALGFDRATMGQVLAGLEDRGFIYRRSSPADRRRKVINLSHRGQAVLRDAAEAVSRTSERILSPLGTDERAIFMELLTRITSELNSDSRTPLEARGGGKG